MKASLLTGFASLVFVSFSFWLGSSTHLQGFPIKILKQRMVHDFVGAVGPKPFCRLNLKKLRKTKSQQMSRSNTRAQTQKADLFDKVAHWRGSFRGELEVCNQLNQPKKLDHAIQFTNLSHLIPCSYVLRKRAFRSSFVSFGSESISIRTPPTTTGLLGEGGVIAVSNSGLSDWPIDSRARGLLIASLEDGEAWGEGVAFLSRSRSTEPRLGGRNLEEKGFCQIFQNQDTMLPRHRRPPLTTPVKR